MPTLYFDDPLPSQKIVAARSALSFAAKQTRKKRNRNQRAARKKGRK